MLKDSNGKWSSKRIMGVIIVVNSQLLDIFGALYSAFVGMKDANSFTTITDKMLWAGCLLLGVGIAESGVNKIKEVIEKKKVEKDLKK
jgi:hypothetical protein